MLVAVCCLAVFASTGVVLGKTVARPHHKQRQMGCLGTLAICAMPVMFLDSNTIQQQVEQEGLNGLCETLVAVNNCVDSARSECESGELELLPPEFEKAVNLLSELVNFVCVAELNNINADRECMFGDELNQAVLENCGAVEPSGEICNLSEEVECGMAQYEATCGNAHLANKFRAFATKVEKMSDCSSRKARSLNWRQLMKLLRR